MEGLMTTYEEACELIQEWGLVPLSGGITNHPTIGAITKHNDWHSGSETDPWVWRIRLATEGKAAYGRMIGNQTWFAHREIFSLVRAALRSEKSVQQRVEEGQLSMYAHRLYELIADNPGMDVRTLRKLAFMSDKSLKKAFDRALVDLQNTADIVISGVEFRLNKQGDKSGWSSTCFVTAESWMDRHGLRPSMLTPELAMEELFDRFQGKWSEEASAYLYKKIMKHRETIGG